MSAAGARRDSWIVQNVLARLTKRRGVRARTCVREVTVWKTVKYHSLLRLVTNVTACLCLLKRFWRYLGWGQTCRLRCKFPQRRTRFDWKSTQVRKNYLTHAISCCTTLRIFFFFVCVCACAVVKRRVSSVARGTVGKSWVTGSCMLCNHGNQADTPQVFVHNKCKYFFRPQSRNVVSVIFKIKNVISTKLPQQFI